MDLFANLAIPDIPTPQLALVEPDLDPGGPERLANASGGLGILRGVAQEHCLGRLRHRPDAPCGEGQGRLQWGAADLARERQLIRI